jgi:hypothetical protein
MRGKTLFQEYFKSDEILNTLTSMQENTSLYSNDSVKKLSDLIISIANKCLTKCKNYCKQENVIKWHHGSDTAKARKQFQRLRYIFRNDQSNLTKRLEFLAAKRKFEV